MTSTQNIVPGQQIVIQFKDSSVPQMGHVVQNEPGRLTVKIGTQLVVIEAGHEAIIQPLKTIDSLTTQQHHSQAKSAEELATTLAKTWQPDDSIWLHRENLTDSDLSYHNGWLLRSAGGVTKRANSVLAIGQTLLETDLLLQLVTNWYSERGQKPIVKWFDQAAISPDLLAEEVIEPSLVMVGSVDVVDQTRLPKISLEITEEAPQSFYVIHKYSDDSVHAYAQQLAHSAPQQFFLTVCNEVNGQLLGQVRFSTADHFGVLTHLIVRSDLRRRGIGRYLMGQAAKLGKQMGISALLLEVTAQNQAAINLYVEQGFETHHWYEYRHLKK